MAPPRDDDNDTQKALIIGGIIAAAGAAALLIARKSGANDDERISSDAPNWTKRSASKGAQPIAAKTLLIARPRAELYARWRDFGRFADFMENIVSVEKLDDERSRWTIKAPAGRTVTLVTRIREEIADRKIAWESEPESDIATKGQVEFEDAGDRGTFVSLVMSYDPPGGRIGQGIAKMFFREPNIQARHDLRRFKQLMETGEVTTNASPSARSSETPTQARI